MSELLLINASRAQLVREVIEPGLRAGDVVLCDRYVHSSLAYQGFGRGLPIETVRAVCDAATGGLMPDLTVYVDVSLDLSRLRVANREREHDRMELEDGAFFERVRRGYLYLASQDDRMIVLDGAAPPADVAAAAIKELDALRR